MYMDIAKYLNNGCSPYWDNNSKVGWLWTLNFGPSPNELFGKCVNQNTFKIDQKDIKNNKCRKTGRILKGWKQGTVYAVAGDYCTKAKKNKLVYNCFVDFKKVFNTTEYYLGNFAVIGDMKPLKEILQNKDQCSKFSMDTRTQIRRMVQIDSRDTTRTTRLPI